MKNILHFFCFLVLWTPDFGLWTPPSVMAQTFPQAQGTTVMINPDGTLRAPANFWTANEAAILALIPPPGSLDIPFATEAQAIAGTSNSLVVNPRAMKAAFEAWVSTGGGTGGGLQAEWLAFNLDKVEGLWLDYELKGSPTNYGIAGQPVLPLYYHSSDPGREIITSQTGPKPLSYFMDTGGSDSRRMVKQDDERSIWAMAKGYVGGVSAYLKVSDLQALSPGANPANWVWSYCRMSATDYERDSSGRVIWRPIVPVPVSAALIAAQTGTGGNLVAEYATGGGVDPPVDPEDPNPPIEGWSVQPDITHNGTLNTLALFPSTTPIAQNEDMSYVYHGVALGISGYTGAPGYLFANPGYSISTLQTPLQPAYDNMRTAQRRLNLLEYYSTGGMTLSASFVISQPVTSATKLFRFWVLDPYVTTTVTDAPFAPYYIEAYPVSGEGNENKVTIRYVRTTIAGRGSDNIDGNGYLYAADRLARPATPALVATLGTVNVGDVCVFSIVSGAEPTRVFFNGSLSAVTVSDTTYRSAIMEGAVDSRAAKYPWFFNHRYIFNQSTWRTAQRPVSAIFTDDEKVMWTSLRVRDRWLSDSEVAELSAGQSEGITLYTLTFDSQGGSAVASQVTTGNVTRPANPTRTGYDFVDWMTTADGSTPFDFISPITANATAYAKWQAKTYTLTFDSQGGSAVASQTVGYGQTWTRPADPTKAGAVFVNWMTTAAGSTPFNFGQMPASNLTAYAKWSAAVTMTFDADGGSAVSPINTYAGATVAAPTATTKLGHYLQGWKIGSGPVQISTNLTAPSTNTTYTAVWVSAFSLTFDSQGGSAVAAQSVRKWSDAPALGGKSFFPVSTKAGHVFARWAADTRGNYFYDYPNNMNNGTVGGRTLPAAINQASTLTAVWYGPGTFAVYVTGDQSGMKNVGSSAPVVTESAANYTFNMLISSTALSGIENGLRVVFSVVADNGASSGTEVEFWDSANQGVGTFSATIATSLISANYNRNVNGLTLSKSALIDIGMNYTFGGVSAGLTGTHFHYRVKLYFSNTLFDTINSPSVHYDISM